MTAGVRFSIKPEFSSTETVRRGVKSAINDWLGSDQDTRVNDFCQAVSELVNNAVEHGHCTCIEGELRIEDEKAVFALTTDGVAFDPTAIKTKMPDFDDKGNLPEGGYGIAIINRLSDEFSYNRVKGKNVTVVAKLFGK